MTYYQLPPGYRPGVDGPVIKGDSGDAGRVQAWARAHPTSPSKAVARPGNKPKPKPAGTSVPKGSAGSVGQPGNPKGKSTVATPPPKPKPPPKGYHSVVVPDPTGDADYKYQMAQYKKQLEDHTNQSAAGLGQYQTSMNQQYRNLGYDPTKHRWDMNNLTPGTLGAATGDIRNVYAARGTSGGTGYQQGLQQAQNQFNQQTNALRNDYGAFTQNRTLTDKSYGNQIDTARTNAYRGAVSRIASRYGVQPNQIARGRTNTVNVRNP